MARPLLLAGILLSCFAVAACNGCGKKTAPAQTLDAAGTIESRAMRRMTADRTTAKLVTLDDLVPSNVDPAGATLADEGELVRLKGTVLEVKESYVVFQNGTYAATCELPPAEAVKQTKGASIELTGFFARGGGHIAARISGCEITPTPMKPL